MPPFAGTWPGTGERSRRDLSGQGQRALIAGGVISPFASSWPGGTAAGGSKDGRPGGDAP